jgi:hypothetical protein
VRYRITIRHRKSKETIYASVGEFAFDRATYSAAQAAVEYIVGVMANGSQVAYKRETAKYFIAVQALKARLAVIH